LGHNLFLPHIFQFIIHLTSFHSMLYSITEKALLNKLQNKQIKVIRLFYSLLMFPTINDRIQLLSKLQQLSGMLAIPHHIKLPCYKTLCRAIHMDKFFISHVASCNKCYLQLIPHCQVTFRSATLLTGTHIMQESLRRYYISYIRVNFVKPWTPQEALELTSPPD
jgi:hypothetical protein